MFLLLFDEFDVSMGPQAYQVINCSLIPVLTGKSMSDISIMVYFDSLSVDVKHLITCFLDRNFNLVFDLNFTFLAEATPKAILRTMGVKGLTLFHLKSHLQKYRLGKQSGKDFGEASNDGSHLLDSPLASNSQIMQKSDLNEAYEVKEALRAQMEVQRKLHLQVEAEKHLQIRQDAERRYMAMLERTCKMLADQIIGAGATDDGDGYQGKGAKAPPWSSQNPLCSYPLDFDDEFASLAPEEVPDILHPQLADCSTESCLTSHESPVIMPLERSSCRERRGMLNMDTTTASFVWDEADVYTPDLHRVQVNSHGITGCGV